MLVISWWTFVDSNAVAEDIYTDRDQEDLEDGEKEAGGEDTNGDRSSTFAPSEVTSCVRDDVKDCSDIVTDTCDDSNMMTDEKDDDYAWFWTNIPEST